MAQLGYTWQAATNTAAIKSARTDTEEDRCHRPRRRNRAEGGATPRPLAIETCLVRSGQVVNESWEIVIVVIVLRSQMDTREAEAHAHTRGRATTACYP